MYDFLEDYVDSKKYGDNIKRTNVDVSYDEEEVGYVFTVSYIDYSNIDADEKEYRNYVTNYLFALLIFSIVYIITKEILLI